LAVEKKIGVVNYGVGNLASVGNALSKLEVDHVFLDEPNKFSSVDKLILPGVGAFSIAMEELRDRGMLDELLRYVENSDRQLLGICLGMQLLLSESCENGNYEGLNLLSGSVETFNNVVEDLPIPNIGWCYINKKLKESKLLSDLTEEQLCFYFVHGYYCKLVEQNVVSATLNYGVNIDVVIEHNNIFGCQFHPEKSQASGLKVLNNFISI
jgi:imidazole glycerol-phosphate synthase subunit HisH